MCSCGHFRVKLVAVRAHAHARCIHVVPRPLWFLWARSGLVTGKFDFVQLSLGVLTRSGLFVDLIESFARFCTCARVSNVPVRSLGFFGSPMRDIALLVGKFSVTDAFADLFKFPTSPCACVCGC